MNAFQKNFIYLSQLIGLPVIDNKTGKKSGSVADLVSGLREMFPKVSGFMLHHKKYNNRFYIPWKNVKKIEESAIVIDDLEEILTQNAKIQETEILLKQTFWDKQIVDIQGSKVVRVNDLHLLKEDLNLWLVHMDVGVTGLIRRLGWIRFVRFFIKLISSYELKDRLISWKFVQPITASIGKDSLSLKIHHSRLSELHPAELADILIDLGTEERITILRSLDQVTAAYSFQELPLKIRTQIAESIDQKQFIGILNEMAMDEVVDVLSQLPKKKTNALLARLPHEKVAEISNLLKHSEQAAGSIMNTEFISIKHTANAGMVLEKIKGESRRKESIYYIYVTDDTDSLMGVVTLRQILTVAPEKVLSEFMRKRVVKVKVNTPIEDVAEIFYKYDFTAVPVVDKQNKIQGVIVMKDAFEAVFHEIKEEAQEAK